MRTWADVAVLARTRNNKGRFVVHATAGLPFLLEEGMEVCFVPPKADVPRSATVESVEEMPDGKALVGFVGIDDPDVCSEMIGFHCLISRSHIPGDAYEEPSDLWSGWEVVEDGSVLGSVSHIDVDRMQPLMYVSTDHGEVLVPIVEDIVVDVDADSMAIHVNLPDGLMDL